MGSTLCRGLWPGGSPGAVRLVRAGGASQSGSCSHLCFFGSRLVTRPLIGLLPFAPPRSSNHLFLGIEASVSERWRDVPFSEHFSFLFPQQSNKNLAAVRLCHSSSTFAALNCATLVECLRKPTLMNF